LALWSFFMIGMAKEGIVVEDDKLLEPWVAMLDEE
jgi:hypothetical protein